MAITTTTTLEPTRVATWDKIGTDIAAAKTIDEALAKARLNFTVEKKPLFTPVADVMTGIDGWCSTVGSDGKIRGVVHDSYEVINNSDAFSLAEALHDEGNLSFVKGGETYKGMSYLIMALPEFKVLGDDVKLYFILQNSFAGQQALKAAIVPSASCARTSSVLLSVTLTTRSISATPAPQWTASRLHVKCSVSLVNTSPASRSMRDSLQALR